MTPRRLALLAALAALLAAAGGAARAQDDEEEIPVVGRPTDVPFSGASGNFQVTARATPAEVQAEKPFTYTVRVTATGPVRHEPVRIDLRRLPRFDGQFHLEDPDPAATRPDATTWEFHYTLKPRSADITEVPALPFAYYNPTTRRFNRAYADAVPLKVTPPAVVAVPLAAPEHVFALETGPGVLDRRGPDTPRWLVAVVLLVLPPVLCLAWYELWRVLYPDAARQVALRRSRAARQALEALRSARSTPAEEAPRSARAVTRYLRQRLDLPAREPTPPEVAAFLARLGYPRELSHRAADFYARCDAARFGPAAAADPLADAARDLVLALEDQPCSPPHS